jgi:cyclic di-GMP phosphodiesterase
MNSTATRASELDDRTQLPTGAATASTTVKSDALRQLKILIIDDEPSILEVLERYLVRGKFGNFISTTDSRQAVELFRQFRPDLVLTDWLMPHSDGLDARLRHLPRPQHSFVLPWAMVSLPQ